MLFPLDKWFDLSQKITKADADLAEAQMMLYALKDGLDPDSPECKKQYRAMRKSVRKHNDKFEK